MNYALAQQTQVPANPPTQTSQTQGQAGGFSSLVFIVVIIIMMWVLIYRPQRKAQKEQKAREESLKKGDRVITTAGIHGTILHVDTRTVTVQISDSSNVKFEKSSIIHVISEKESEGKKENK